VGRFILEQFAINDPYLLPYPAPSATLAIGSSLCSQPLAFMPQKYLNAQVDAPIGQAIFHADMSNSSTRQRRRLTLLASHRSYTLVILNGSCKMDDFYARRYVSAVFGVVILHVRPSVRLFVCLSIRPSHACFVTKPNNALRLF